MTPRAVLRGYGGDKICFVANLAARGLRFIVHPTAFVVDVPHKSSRDRLVVRDASRMMHKSAVYGLLALMQRRMECDGGGGGDGDAAAAAQPLGTRASTCDTASMTLVLHQPFSGPEWVTAIPFAADDGLGNVTCERAADEAEARLLGAPSYARVRIGAGTWSPVPTFESGLDVGGFTMKYALPSGRGAEYSRLVLCFWVRFPQDFRFAKGGKLLGVVARNTFIAGCQWRSGGRASFALSRVGAAVASGGGAPGGQRVAARFMPGRWALVEQEFCADARASCGCRLDGGAASSHEVRHRAWVNGSLCHDECATVPCSRARATRGVADFVHACAFYGGATVDWAAPVDTHVDIADVRVWGDQHCVEGPPGLPPVLSRARSRLLFCISPGRCVVVARRCTHLLQWNQSLSRAKGVELCIYRPCSQRPNRAC